MALGGGFHEAAIILDGPIGALTQSSRSNSSSFFMTSSATPSVGERRAFTFPLEIIEAILMDSMC